MKWALALCLMLIAGSANAFIASNQGAGGGSPTGRLLITPGSAMLIDVGSALLISQNGGGGTDPTVGLLTSDRDFWPNWKMAGLLPLTGGSIPARTTQCGSTVSPLGGGSDDTADIQAAINACTAGDFVNLSAGTFTIAEGHTVQVNAGVTLRGAGPGSTIIEHPPGADSTGGVCNSPGAWGATIGSPCPGNSPSPVVNLGGSGSGSLSVSTTLASDAAQGSFSVSVTSATGITPGDLVLVDEIANAQFMPDQTFNNGGTYGAFTGSVSGTTLTAGSPSSGTIQIGALIQCSGCAYGTTVTADGSGSGGAGTYTVSPSQTVGSQAMTASAVVFAEPDYRVEWNCHGPLVGSFDSGPCSNSQISSNGDACDYSERCGGVNEEEHLVTAVNGTTVTFDSPLTLSYRVANNAKLWVYSGMVSQAGLESMTVEYGDNGNVTMDYCQYCWAYKVESENWLNGGFQMWHAAFRDQLDTYYVHNAAWPVNGGAGYNISLTYGASEDLIWNGISVLANKQEVVRASGSGVVFAYNYMDDSYINGSSTDSWVETGLNCSHLAGSHGCLFEGNMSDNTDNDFTHGSSGHMTFFRNDVTGYRNPFTALDGNLKDDATGCCGPMRALGDHAYTYWDNFVGNVAGSPGQVQFWTYRCAAGNADSGCWPALFNLGWNDTSIGGSGPDGTMELSYPTQPNGSNATITGPGCLNPQSGDGGSFCVPIVDGNFDYKTSAVQWAANDSAHTLPNSFFLTAAPAFFSAGSGYSWPWVTPTASVPIANGPSTGSCSSTTYDSTNSASTSIGTISGGGSFTWTLPHAIPAGETAVITLAGAPGNGTSTPAEGFASVSDNAATYDSWKMLGYAVGDNRFQWATQQFVVLASHGASTITVFASPNSGGLQFMSAVLDLFTNVNAIDGSAANYQNNPGTGSNAITTGNLTAFYSGDLIYGAINSAQSQAATAGTGFTAGQSGITSEYILSSSGTGIKAATFNSATGTDEWVTAAVALRCNNTRSPLPARARYDAGTPFVTP